MSFLCKWFGIGCPKPPTPIPPVPPAPTPADGWKPIAIVVYDVNGKPLPGATVKLDGNPNVYPQTNRDGYTIVDVPMSLQASQLYVTIAGYVPFSVHVDLPMHGEDLVVAPSTIPLHENQMLVGSLTSDHFDPSSVPLRTLARIRGAMWTVRGPWRFGPRPGSPDNITALEFIYSYGDPLNAFALNDEQKAQIAKYKGLGYTHVAFGPPCAQSYHGQYPDTDFSTSPEMFDKFLDWLQMWWDNGLTPVVFMHKDGASFDETVAMWDHLIRGNARAQRLIRIIVPTGWEPTKYDWSSKTWAAYCKWAREILPNALVLIHTVADVDAPVGTDALYDDNGKPNAEGWSHVTPYIHGWLVQSSAFENPDAHSDPNNPQNTNFDNWANQFDKNVRGSYYDRFHNGYAGWPRNSAWGDEPIYIYAAEFASYWEYWQNRPYDEGVKWGDRAIRAGADGVLDSCSIDVPPAKG
jgi:hypothetical protein